MSIKIQCPRCGGRTGVNVRMAGRIMRCPSCDAEIAIPTHDQIAAAKRRKQQRSEDHSVHEAEAIPWAAAIPMAESAEAVAATEEDTGFEPLEIGRKNREETELDMTPMVDVTFLLLIFFMVTASFTMQNSIELPAQQSDAPSSTAVEQVEDEMDQVTLQIDERGAFMVLSPEWEREVAGKPSLVAALRDARQSIDGLVRLAIECHEAAKLQALVDAMDAGAIAEYNELQVTQVDGF